MYPARLADLLLGLTRPTTGTARWLDNSGGLAVGDIDNDGDVDIYVTCYGPDVLLRNRGDGTFEDASPEAGLDRAPPRAHHRAQRAVDGVRDVRALAHQRVEVRLRQPEQVGSRPRLPTYE